MESLFVEIAKQAPSLAVLCFVVVQFLRALRSRDEEYREAINRIERAHQESAKSIQENSRVIGQACQVIENAVECIKDSTHYRIRAVK